jgi:DNA-binding MarR family transcriptional regulator
MARRPSANSTAAWTSLIRAQHALMDAIEGELKDAGFPPLSWYDVLLELSRAPRGSLRPVELEKRMLLPQYGLSRLIDRMVEAELAVRTQCPVDKRGNFVGITETGRDVQKKMGSAYSAAIERHVGSKLTDVEAQKLAQLLERLKTPASVH